MREWSKIEKERRERERGRILLVIEFGLEQFPSHSSDSLQFQAQLFSLEK